MIETTTGVDMRTGSIARLAMGIVLLMVLLASTGCIEMAAEDVPEFLRPDDSEFTEEVVTDESVDGETPEGWEDGTDRHGREMPYGTHGHGIEVLMMGRSVMAGWFQHWGWDWASAVPRDGFAFYYGELDGPPDIADRAIDYIERAPQTTVVFYKLCFVDFSAYSEEDVETRLAENVGYAQEVVDAAVARDITLVLANALPETASNTTVHLAELHDRYGAELERIASEHEGVHVFDIHGVLANQTGVLYKGFAVEPSDAHLTELAYLELDDAFTAFMDEEVLPTLD